MQKGERFSFVGREGGAGEAGLLPFAPIQLRSSERSIRVMGLLDTGATVNVLPFSVGSSLGLLWQEQKTVIRLTGNLSNQEARAVLLESQIGSLGTVRLAFAWTQSEAVPVILGQVNFFMEFDVCFFRAERVFEIRRR